MTILVAYEVVEHYPDIPGEDHMCPEPFGTYLHDVSAGTVKISDIVQLKWLDGRDAYTARVEHIRSGVLHVVATSSRSTTKESSDAQR